MKEKEDFVYFMKIALQEARKAFIKDEVPVGAVLVKNDEVIAKAHNIKEGLNDPTGHAEILVIKKGAQKTDNWRLIDSTLYVTKEPCIMCTGAILNARIGRLVYGCRDDKGGAVDSLFHLLSDKRLNHKVQVISGVLKDECSEILQCFFKTRR